MRAPALVLATCVLTMLSPGSAAASGTLEISEKITWPVFAWVDGEPVGKIKKGHTATVDAGTHEVWLAGDDNGVYTYCHGTVEVAEGAVAAVSAKPKLCEGLTLDAIGASSAANGAVVTYQLGLGDEFSFMVSVDAAIAQPIGPNRSLNLSPGEHHLVFSTAEGTSSRTFDAGVLRVEAGDSVKLTCSLAGCLGLLHP